MMLSSLSKLFLRCVYLLTITIMADTEENCTRFRTLKVDFTMRHTSTQVFPIQIGHECFDQCSGDKNCVAIVMSKAWKERTYFCQILMHDKKVAADLTFGHCNISTNQGIWVNSVATASTPEATTTEATTTEAATTKETTEETTTEEATTEQATTKATTSEATTPDGTTQNDVCPPEFTPTAAGCWLMHCPGMDWQDAVQSCRSLKGSIHLLELDSQMVLLSKPWYFSTKLGPLLNTCVFCQCLKTFK